MKSFYKAALIVLAMNVLVVVIGLFAAFPQLSTMSAHGFIALALGIILTVALSLGLLWLLYYSRERGYDEPREF